MTEGDWIYQALSIQQRAEKTQTAGMNARGLRAFTRR